MLTYEEFEKILSHCKNFYDRLNQFEEATGNTIELWEITNGGCLDDVIHLLQKIFNDTNEWISYWIFDLEWGTQPCPLTVLSPDGSITDLTTMRGLYNLLTANRTAN